MASVNNYDTYQATALPLGMYLFWLGEVYKLEVASYGLKTTSKTIYVHLRMLPGFSHNNCVGLAQIVRPHLDYCECVTGCDEFIWNYMYASRSSFIIFTINLVHSNTAESSSERYCEYTSCGCSVLRSKYESMVGTAHFWRQVLVSSNHLEISW